MRTTRLIPLLAILLLFSSAVAGRAGGRSFQDAPASGKKVSVPTEGRYLFRRKIGPDEYRIIVRIEKVEGGFLMTPVTPPTISDGDSETQVVRDRWDLKRLDEEMPPISLKTGEDRSFSGIIEYPARYTSEGKAMPGRRGQAHFLEFTGKILDDMHAEGTWIARTAENKFIETGNWSVESIESELAELESDPQIFTRCRNTLAAIQMLRTINAGQAVFEAGIGAGQYTPDLRQLGGQAPEDVGLVAADTIAAQVTPKSGYLLGPLKYRRGDKAKGITAGFSITCYPVIAHGPNRTGDDCFYVDETLVIRHSGAPDIPAGPDSPPIGN